MNVQDRAITLRTADDFLRWNEGREGKREFVDGRIVEMMVGVSKAHWKLETRLSRLFGDHLDDLAYDFGTADFGVRTAEGVRYPDFLVARASGTGKDLAADAPILLAEILSPSSLALDFGEKAMEYTAIPSLRHYLVISQDEPRLWIWNRGPEGFGSPEMIAGREAEVPLAAFGFTLALADLYRGIV